MRKITIFEVIRFLYVSCIGETEQIRYKQENWQQKYIVAQGKKFLEQ